MLLESDGSMNNISSLLHFLHYFSKGTISHFEFRFSTDHLALQLWVSSFYLTWVCFVLIGCFEFFYPEWSWEILILWIHFGFTSLWIRFRNFLDCRLKALSTVVKPNWTRKTEVRNHVSVYFCKKTENVW